MRVKKIGSIRVKNGTVVVQRTEESVVWISILRDSNSPDGTAFLTTRQTARLRSLLEKAIAP